MCKNECDGNTPPYASVRTEDFATEDVESRRAAVSRVLEALNLPHDPSDVDGGTAGSTVCPFNSSRCVSFVWLLARVRVRLECACVELERVLS